MNRRPQLCFEFEKCRAVFTDNEANGKTVMPKAARASDSVKVGFGVVGEVEVDDYVDGLYVDSAG